MTRTAMAGRGVRVCATRIRFHSESCWVMGYLQKVQSMVLDYILYTIKMEEICRDRGVISLRVVVLIPTRKG